MFRTLVVGMAVTVGFVGAALSDTAPPAAVSMSGSFDVADRVSGGNDGGQCTGEEVLRVKCQGRRPFRAIVARVRRGQTGMELEFCLFDRGGELVECKTDTVNSNGLAKVRFHDDLSPDRYTVKVEACGLTSKAIHCP